MTWLQVKNLQAGYGDEDVLRNVSFDLAPGTITCILGENGCGKTTLLRALSGTLASRGTMTFKGEDMRRWRPRQRATRLALMAQQGGTYFPFTVRETLEMGRSVGPSLAHPDTQIVSHLLTTHDLQPLADTRIDTLSGGERQRVFLARAIAQYPELLLLDEPSNHLDVAHQMKLEQQLRAFVADGQRSVICVMHDILLARRIGGRAILVKDGHVIAHGDRHQIYTHETLQRAYDVDVLSFLEDLAQETETDHVQEPL